MNHYDNPEFFAAYAQMSRSQQGLSDAGEWHYINLYLLVVMYCNGIWGEAFDLITEELESIFIHFIEVYDPIYKQPHKEAF